MISQELNDMITRVGPGTQAGAHPGSPAHRMPLLST